MATEPFFDETGKILVDVTKFDSRQVGLEHGRVDRATLAKFLADELKRISDPFHKAIDNYLVTIQPSI